MPQHEQQLNTGEQQRVARLAAAGLGCLVVPSARAVGSPVTLSSPSSPTCAR